MVTDIAAKMQKVEKRRKETPRLKSCKQYQCDWCRRLLQNPSGLIRHKSYCVWNPILRTKTGKSTSSSWFYPIHGYYSTVTNYRVKRPEALSSHDFFIWLCTHLAHHQFTSRVLVTLMVVSDASCKLHQQFYYWSQWLEPDFGPRSLESYLPWRGHTWK